MRRPRVPEVALGALLLLTAAAYANALAASFQFDDWRVVVSDPRVRSLAAWTASMPGIRPLLKLSYALNHEAGGSAAGFHAANVAIHLANVALAWLVGRRLMSRHQPDPARAAIAAAAGAAVFALHPIQTEAVTYVSGRSASLAGTFALASSLAWLDGRARGSRVLLLGAAPAAFAAAILVKESALVLPAVLLVLAATDPRPSPRSLLRDLAPMAGVALLATAVALASPTYRWLAETSASIRGVGANLITQARGIAFLAGQIARPDRLSADPALPASSHWTPGTALAAAAIAALLASAALSIRRRPAFALGVLWFFLWLAPTNSLVPRLDVANDRQVYLAILGPAWLAGLALARARRTAAAAVAVAIVALLLGAGTVARNRVYRTEVAFWEDAVAKAQASARAQNNLGYAYALSGRTADAEAAFRRALALDPGHVRAAVNLRLLHEGTLTDGTRPD